MRRSFPGDDPATVAASCWRERVALQSEDPQSQIPGRAQTFPHDNPGHPLRPERQEGVVSTSSIGAMAKSAIGWSIALSVLIILSGILAILVPPAAGIAATIVIGWLLIFSGVMHLVLAWQTRSAGGLVWQFLIGVAYTAVGIYMLMHPVLGLAALTLSLSVYLFAEAILEFLLAARLRSLGGRGWLILDGVVTLVLAILIWKTWPSSSPWVIGTLLGINLIFSGTTRLMLLLAARRVAAA